MTGSTTSQPASQLAIWATNQSPIQCDSQLVNRSATQNFSQNIRCMLRDEGLGKDEILMRTICSAQPLSEQVNRHGRAV